MDTRDAQRRHRIPTEDPEAGPVECLGRSFPNDGARRAHFLGRLRVALEELRARLEGVPFESVEDTVERLGQLRSWPVGEPSRLRGLATRMRDVTSSPDLLGRWKRVTGFPLGGHDEILDLSDPPFYTACPNPFLPDVIDACGNRSSTDDASHRQPHTGALRASTRHPVYAFHPYHTKVPPDVIRRLIQHYTAPGDLVLDGFGGTGMTGVAARECGRHAIVGDLCPVAGFVAGVNSRSHRADAAIGALVRILDESETAWSHLYRTEERGCPLRVNYYVWSDVFGCPECGHEFPFFPHAVVHHGTRVQTRKTFSCPSCPATLNVRRVQRCVVDGRKQKRLVWVNAGSGRDRVNRAPNDLDLELGRQADRMDVPAWHPTDRIDPAGYSARLAQLGDKTITDVSRLLSRRNLIVFADLWRRIAGLEDHAIRNLCRATLTSIFTVVSERQGYFGGGGGMSGNLYMPIVRMEKNVHDSLRRKLRKLESAEHAKAGLTSLSFVTTQSATAWPALPDACVDYVYTDPPFGANIIYSEMNLILESWLRVRTQNGAEAVIDETRGRDANDYAGLIRASFREYRRVLKPGRWMTVEFHNTAAEVWNLIQNAIGESGFVVAQVGVLDKGSTTILGDIRPASAKHDLIISAYRPEEGFERRFRLEAGTEEGVWDFVHTHLRQLPVIPDSDAGPDLITERKSHLLFDRMLAFHVQRGIAVPMSAAAFNRGLRRRFVERDAMFFLPDQAAEHERRRVAPGRRAGSGPKSVIALDAEALSPDNQD